ncbi:hypothetical protein BJF85_06105 [Saccharomonospora sp. CUA-673]|uniref:hypothetical protein n=1 Tax=Saccharomonospora sp. CUA-673 TaxID=1904969 RepID=UPI00095AB603|nr:hypothetical protein [Saccharomonospora sp. CUA-673]OLT40690.1 hypothetical protein BJF85_06105 [Saccharomonospora sp. CUA-673]
MGTPAHINTTVNGSVGMLEEAAQALREAKKAAESADDSHCSARNTAYSSWEGDAAGAFLDELAPHLKYTRQLGATCGTYAEAFADLGGAIESVNKEMGRARRTATEGGLEVEGPFIRRPEEPAMERPMPTNYSGPNAKSDFFSDRETWNNLIGDFNAKAEVFNTCLQIYTDARKKEEQAHTEFWEALDADQGFGLKEAWDMGRTTASHALNTVASMENTRADLLRKISSLEGASKTYQSLAAGAVNLNGLPAQQRTQIMRDLSRAKGSETTYRTQMQQLDKVRQHVPESVRVAATASPGDIAPNTPLGNKVGSVARKVPWVGGLLTAGNEALGAATGEQTWGKAVASSAGQLGGGWVGGVTGAAACSSLFPPVGPVVCGAAGMGFGAIAGDKIVDTIIPDESDLPEEVDRLRPAGKWGTSGQ